MAKGKMAANKTRPAFTEPEGPIARALNALSDQYRKLVKSTEKAVRDAGRMKERMAKMKVSTAAAKKKLRVKLAAAESRIAELEVAKPAPAPDQSQGLQKKLEEAKKEIARLQGLAEETKKQAKDIEYLKSQLKMAEQALSGQMKRPVLDSQMEIELRKVRSNLQNVKAEREKMMEDMNRAIKKLQAELDESKKAASATVKDEAGNIRKEVGKLGQSLASIADSLSGLRKRTKRIIEPVDKALKKANKEQRQGNDDPRYVDLLDTLRSANYLGQDLERNLASISESLSKIRDQAKHLGQSAEKAEKKATDLKKPAGSEGIDLLNDLRSSLEGVFQTVSEMPELEPPDSD